MLCGFRFYDLNPRVCHFNNKMNNLFIIAENKTIGLSVDSAMQQNLIVVAESYNQLKIKKRHL